MKVKKKKQIDKFRCVSCRKLKPETNIRASEIIEDDAGFPVEVLYCKKCNDKTIESLGQ